MKYILLLFTCLSNSQNIDYLPALNTNQVVNHTYFTLSYSEACEQAEWVAYELKKERLNGQVKRSNKFKIDLSVTTGSAELSDYKHSGYDKGHLVPAADMAFNQLAMNESFYISNIIWIQMMIYNLNQ